MTLSGSITGAGGMTVTAAAMLTLSNTGNTFSGGINLNGGTVAVSSISDLGSGTNTLTFNNGGELLYTGAECYPKVFNYTFNGNGRLRSPTQLLITRLSRVPVPTRAFSAGAAQ